MIHLVIGGARSGKSRFAEQLIMQSGCASPVYIATATAGDNEMAQRIRHHQQQRANSDAAWQLLECPLALAETLTSLSGRQQPVLVDCLTLWLTNQLLADVDMQQCRSALCQAVAHFDGELVLVTNEVGAGIVPLGELSRRFVDEAGWLNQQLASIADQVTLVVAGLPLTLKQ
ncbi:bifunctional adenosylcobinamide kinase/adenosylcobinamide-phosphate guanylyltransferase [Shewanella avicenniae]|uniref:Bifunctional adenosylcobalamin biosynthesis protein n=1 Tax=Shewanella avicenniae TaxID=2814294 RepID=A0ABX7QTZ6_9GAMM|nr:bifunctional adenosylcobinamide kinase/adenosylcobinamide-phosphate guanylyltransferase [Shewanella avicenniae]QSX34406.1 bifunctional adenosylcobinamide kinase/adenosylcobinamide-phosphate guanylyltransferase [Shewanella avicenniae]